jgi:putative transposase
LKDFNLTLGFKGKLKWRGKKSRLEIIYNDARRSWYAHIPVEVVNIPETKGDLRASVDLGIVNLATVYAEDGTWYIFKGGGVLSQYEYYSKKISRVQKVLARHGQRKSWRLKLLYDKGKRFLRHALNSMVRKIMEELKERGVRKVVVGHPEGVARNQGNKLTVNFWNYGYIIKRFKEIGEELGISVTDVGEPNTSRNCSLCGDAHKNGRIKRGLFKCPRMGKVMNADLNGAINILHIPESLGARRGGQLLARDRGNGLKTSLVYRWTNGAGWVQIAPTSYEAMKMKAVNHKPMIRPEGNPPLGRGGGQHILISLNETDLSHEKRNRNFASEGGGIRERLFGRFK